MLKQEESLVFDERYRQTIEDNIPNSGLFNFEEAMAVLTSQKADIDNQHRVIILMRKYLSLHTSQIPSKYRKILIVRLVQLSNQKQYLQLRYQALTSLVNISFNYINHNLLINDGALQLFFQLIHDENVLISRQSLCGIGNIATNYHWQKIGLKGVRLLLEFRRSCEDEKTNELLLWVVAIMLQQLGNEADPEILKAMFPVYHSVPEYISQYWVGALQYHFKYDKARILFQNGTVANLLKYLSSQNYKLVYESTKLIEILMLAGNEVVEELLELNLIGIVTKLLENETPFYEALTYLLACLSNRDDFCKKRLAASQNTLRKLIALPFKEPINFSINMEIAYVFYRIYRFADTFKIYQLFKEYNFVSIYLEEPDIQFFKSMIYTLSEFLELGEKFKENGKNIFVEALRKGGAIEKWQYFLLNDDEFFVSLLYAILQKYFDF